MTQTLVIVQFILAVVLTIVVLLQKSSSIGLGAYSGSNESVFGAKGPQGFLTKLTFGLALTFLLNTLALGYFYNKANKPSIAEQMKENKIIPAALQKKQTPKAPVAPSAPTAPVTDKK